jgi:hypothetical protein
MKYAQHGFKLIATQQVMMRLKIEMMPHCIVGLPTMQKTLKEKSRNMVANASVGRACGTGARDAEV